MQIFLHFSCNSHFFLAYMEFLLYLCTRKIKANGKTERNISQRYYYPYDVAKGFDYICITDIARQKNPIEPKDVVKNWMRLKNTLEYLGLWEMLNNPNFKGVEFDPLFTRFINEGMPQQERLHKLNQIAIQQMTVLENVESKHILKA